MGFFFCRGCVRGTQYQGLVGLYPSSHSESVSHTVFAGLISLEVLHIVPGVLPVSIPEPLNPENASLMFVVTLSDQKVNYRLNRFTSRGRKGGDLARSQGPRPGRVPLWWLLWGKPPDRADTTPLHEPGTGREQSRNTPLGG